MIQSPETDNQNCDFIQRCIDTEDADMESFRAQIPSKWFDLVGNGFVFDGDSIILFLLSELRMNQKSPSFIIDDMFGRSSLHLIFSVRRFLKRYLAMEYQIKILFFTNNIQQINDVEYEFYRSSVLQDLIGLQSHIPSLQVLEFASYHCEEFSTFLRKQSVDLTICEAIVLDFRVKSFKQFAKHLCDTYRVAVIHLPSLSGPNAVADVMTPRIYKNQSVAIGINRMASPYFSVFPSIPRALNDALDDVFIIQDTIWNHFNEKCQSNDNNQTYIDLCNIVISHALYLCIVSLLPMKWRYIQNLTESSDIRNHIAIYRKEFFTKCLSYQHNINSFCMNDLWDGRFLVALNTYCKQYGHKALMNQLSQEHKNKIESSQLSMFHHLCQPVDIIIPNENITNAVGTYEASFAPRKLENV